MNSERFKCMFGFVLFCLAEVRAGGDVGIADCCLLVFLMAALLISKAQLRQLVLFIWQNVG